MEINLKTNRASAKVNLNLGGSVQELFLDNRCIIKNESEYYKDNYASAILFPFVSRIEDGKYQFKGKKHQLYCNDDKFNNAIHGLVYNKKFSLIKSNNYDDYAIAVIEYEEKEGVQGFPFKYKIQVEYLLKKTLFNLKVSIENLDVEDFPFTIGWHPYFYSSNLFDSSVSFKSDKTLELSERLLPIKVLDKKIASEIKIKDKEFDDCFYLNDNLVTFFTPEYKMYLTSDSKKSYLQIYSPAHRKSLAIEPQTGVSNSFNNQEGLQVVKPNKEYSINWKIEIEKAPN